MHLRGLAVVDVPGAQALTPLMDFSVAELENSGLRVHSLGLGHQMIYLLEVGSPKRVSKSFLARSEGARSKELFASTPEMVCWSPLVTRKVFMTLRANHRLKRTQTTFYKFSCYPKHLVNRY